MLTMFAVPKAFHGHVGMIQRNALRSWLRLDPRPEVILFGEDEGVAEFAAELGVRHLPELAKSTHGTPLISDAFSQAQEAAQHDTLCYVNADIILMSDFLAAVRGVLSLSRPSLMVGRRWDVDVKEELAFDDGWEERLRSETRTRGVLHEVTGIDYFVFRKGLWGESMPAFAIGRTAWDNWLLFEARRRKAALVDATRMVTIVHQNHDYAHVAGGVEGAWKGQESQENVRLAGGYARMFTIGDATWELRSTGITRAIRYYPLRAYNWLRRRGLAWRYRHKFGRPHEAKT